MQYLMILGISYAMGHHVDSRVLEITLEQYFFLNFLLFISEMMAKIEGTHSPLSHDVGSVSEITPCNKIKKQNTSGLQIS